MGYGIMGQVPRSVILVAKVKDHEACYLVPPHGTPPAPGVS